MSQESTLIDIYSYLAKILDSLGSGTGNELQTKITQGIELSSDKYALSKTLTLDNPKNESLITLSQTAVNEAVNTLLTLSKDNRIQNDAVLLGTDNLPVPIPKGQPIVLLPKLIELLLGRNLPLKVLLDIIFKILEDILIETLRRKLLKPDIKETISGIYSKSRVFKIPENARYLRLEAKLIPSYISKRFDNYDNKEDISNLLDINPDLNLYTGFGLMSVAFGFSGSDNVITRSVYWLEPTQISWQKSLMAIPDFGFNSGFRYCSIYLNANFSVLVSWI